MPRCTKITLFLFALTIFSVSLVKAQNSVSLVINEFMASNSDSIQDPQGEFDDWIEIYNFGTNAIDTGGMNQCH